MINDRTQLQNDQEEAMRLALDGRQSTIWTAMPCIITSIDFSKMTLAAQPAIQGTVEDESGNKTVVNLPLVVDVPIGFPSGGGFLITLPIAAGDEVLVVFASRCIDAWWQSGGVQRPMEMRMHDLSDGFAIPGPRSQPKVASSISTTGLQIRNNAGTSYVEISADGKIKLVSPSEIDIIGNLVVTGNATMTGNISLTGTLAVTGSISATVEVAAGPGPVHLAGHVHTGVTTGPNNTGAAVG